MHDWYTIVYVYDHGSVPIGMKYRATDDTLWTNYWFEKNLQGDIIAIWDNWGVKLLSYTYDAWGNHNYTVHYNDGVGGYYYNNFRYRGYYYDSDLGLYRTQTRLYDANTGRFISPEPNVYKSFFDRIHPILKHNAYNYCINNPIKYYDPTGEWTFTINFGFFVGFGGGYSLNLGLSFDSEEMIALQLTYSVPNNGDTRNTVIGLTAGASLGMQYTNYDSVSKLEDKGKAIGVNTPLGSFDAIQDYTTDDITGFAIGVGPSVGGDFHVNQTQTITIGDKFRSLFKIIKDWLGF